MHNGPRRFSPLRDTIYISTIIPTRRAVGIWCVYRAGDPDEALHLLAEQGVKVRKVIREDEE